MGIRGRGNFRNSGDSSITVAGENNADRIYAAFDRTSGRRVLFSTLTESNADGKLAKFVPNDIAVRYSRIPCTSDALNDRGVFARGKRYE